MEILVIDDNLGIRIFLKKALELGNHNITLCKNGLEAFALLSQENPPLFDLCLVDIMMPEMDGIKFLKELNKLNYKTKTCMLTSLSDENNINECLSLGINDYIVKPIDKDTILDKVELIVNGSTINSYATVNSKIQGKIDEVDIIISDFSEFEISFFSFEEIKGNKQLESDFFSFLSKDPYIIISCAEKSNKLFKHKCIWSGLTEKDKIQLRNKSMTQKDIGYEKGENA